MFKAALVLACTLVLACAAIVAVDRQQAESTQARDAELALTGLRLDLSQIQDVPWGASPDEGDNADEVRGELMWREDLITSALAKLDLATDEDIAAPFARGMVALRRILELVAKGRSDETDKASRVAAHEIAKADEALQRAAKRYHAHSLAALTQSRNGSAAVIVLLFAAFAVVYRRAAVARRRAERLAAENHELLRASREEALTDALTGLGNRRALMADLAAARPTVEGEQLLLVLFDLDGFKQYNDSFGHPAGDSLLARLGERLSATMDGIGHAYRMGGDEFCVTAPVAAEGAEAIARLAAAALSDEGTGFSVGCSYGFALMPADTTRAEEALLMADQRMYAQKQSGRVSPGRQSADVLLRLLAERSLDLEHHSADVALLAARTAERLGLMPDEVERIRLAAELHDVGKAAIPDAILLKRGPLNDDEWAFVRRHTVIGERIVRAAPSLAHTADLVRWHHERTDGTGYPDALPGAAIPVGARIIAVCDVFDAIVSDRPYRDGRSVEDALAELRRCAGTQFDPAVVDAFTAVVSLRERV
ncbi:MAG TPA: diguanylate cyclase [Solirubrobacteraceae bacterium]|nr:diguanylate cyclase [Solirubrobacteraceae bacterium]